jgi:hypothetical protein
MNFYRIKGDETEGKQAADGIQAVDARAIPLQGEEILKQLLARFRQHRLRMELHTF